MVGVPGRSKGCITCKQRRVKCDEKRPFCDRFRGSWVPCGGYVQDTIFVDESIRLRQSSDQSEQAGSSLEWTQTEPVDAQISGSTENAIWTASLSTDIGLRAHQSNIYMSFLIHRLFSDTYRDGSPGPRILRAIDEDATSVVYNSAYCLAAALFERTHFLEHSEVTHGAIEYGHALRLLNRTIQDRDVCYEPANVVATILLSLYEMVIFTNRHGWIQHAGGVEKLIEMRGVDIHRGEQERHYFIMSRMPIITKALTLQRRTFLDQEEWKTIPWADEPESKTPGQYVQDILADIPGLLEDSNVLKAEQASQVDGNGIRIKGHCSRLIKTLQELFLWRWEWERSNPEAAYEVTVDLEAFPRHDSRLPMYETVFHYKSFEPARTMMLYNAALLWILDLAKMWIGEHAIRLALLPFPIEERPPALNPLTLPNEDLAAANVSQEVCRSAEYHLQEPHFHSGAMFLMLPLRAVWKLGQGEKERVWSGWVLRRIADSHGFGISRGLQDRIAMAAGLESLEGQGKGQVSAAVKATSENR